MHRLKKSPRQKRYIPATATLAGGAAAATGAATAAAGGTRHKCAEQNSGVS